MALIDFTDGDALPGDDLDSNFQEIQQGKNETKISYEDNVSYTSTSGNYSSSGGTVWKQVLKARTGDLINTITVSIFYRLFFSTQPTIKLQYSTDNSSWTDWDTASTVQSSGHFNQVVAAKTDFSSNVVYLRIVNESQSGTLYLNAIDINVHTDNYRTFVVSGKTRSYLIDEGGSEIAKIRSVTSADTYNDLVVPVCAPQGMTINSVSVYGIGNFSTGGSVNVTVNTEYSTDGSSWSAVDEESGYSQSNPSSSGAPIPFWGMVESLNSQVVYMSLSWVSSASPELTLRNGYIWVTACYE